MRNLVIFILLLTGMLPMAADTISIDRAWIYGPCSISIPYSTDSLDLKGQAFDASRLLDMNKGMVEYAKVSNSSIVEQGVALKPQSICVFGFTIDADKFVKASIKAEKLSKFKTFVNGVEQQDQNLKLTPGRTEVDLLCYTSETAKDSFFVSLEGDDVKELKINSENKRLFTFDDLVHGTRYYSVSLSPSGRYLVSVTYDTRHDGSVQYETKISDFSNGRIILKRSEYLRMRWMPKRDVLYYTRQTDGALELVTLNPEDNSEEVLARNIPQGDFSISPTEDFLVYSISANGPEENNGLKHLFAPDDRQPGWRTRNVLYLYDLKKGFLTQLTHGTVSAYLSDISQDGKKLLISYSRMDLQKLPFDRTTYIEYDMSTHKVDTLLSDTAFVGHAIYSPDAKQLLIKATPAAFGGAFSEVLENQVPQGFDQRLYLYDIATKSVRPLLKHFLPSVDRFDWSSADGFIYMNTDDGYDKTLFRLNPQSGELIRYQLPVTTVSGYSVAKTKNPRLAFFGQSANRSRECYMAVLNKENPKVQRIGDFDFDKWTTDMKLPTCDTWRFRSERGDTIHGFYFLPPDFDSSAKYPMIVYYYGGCTPTTRAFEFHYPLSVLAGQGYVVLVLEPSGAIGFGQEFAARHVGTWGQMSADDIIEGTTKFASEHAYVDASRVGCMGASYGGFMTQYLQTRTDIFAAAISHAGISNIASYWGGGYWGYTYGQVAQYGSYPWNNPELYVQQSPLFNADKIHTPLLLLHGTADTNVPTNESQQLYTALRILGREVAYVQVDGENHVITNYKKRLAWQNVIFAWFAKYLKGEPLWWDDLGYKNQ